MRTVKKERTQTQLKQIQVLYNGSDRSGNRIELLVYFFQIWYQQVPVIAVVELPPLEERAQNSRVTWYILFERIRIQCTWTWSWISLQAFACTFHGRGLMGIVITANHTDKCESSFLFSLLLKIFNLHREAISNSPVITFRILHNVSWVLGPPSPHLMLILLISLLINYYGDGHELLLIVSFWLFIYS